MASLATTLGVIDLDGSGKPVVDGSLYSDVIAGAEYHNAAGGSGGEVGPTSWATAATAYNGTDDRIDSGSTLASLGDNFLISLWFKQSPAIDQTVLDNQLFGVADNSIGFEFGHSNPIYRGAAIGRQADGTFLDSGPVTHDSTTWAQYGAAYRDGEVQTVKNGVVVASTAALVGGFNTPANTVRFGVSTTRHAVGDFSQLLIVTGVTDDDLVAVGGGPEPTNSVVPLLNGSGSTLSWGSGTWDSQSNGTLTYTYVLQRRVGSAWTTVYEGTATTLTDATDGTYRVWSIAENDAGVGDPVASASAVVGTSSLIGAIAPPIYCLMATPIYACHEDV